MDAIQCAYIEGEAILFAPDNPASVSAGQPFNLTLFAIDNMGVVPGVRFTLTGIDHGPASGVTDGWGQCMLTGFSFGEPGKKTIRARAVIGGVAVHSAHRMIVVAGEGEVDDGF